MKSATFVCGEQKPNCASHQMCLEFFAVWMMALDCLMLMVAARCRFAVATNALSLFDQGGESVHELFAHQKQIPQTQLANSNA